MFPNSGSQMLGKVEMLLVKGSAGWVECVKTPRCHLLWWVHPSSAQREETHDNCLSLITPESSCHLQHHRKVISQSACT